MPQENKVELSVIKYPDLLKVSVHSVIQHPSFEKDLKELLSDSGNRQMVRKQFMKIGSYLSQDIVTWKSACVFGQIVNNAIYHYYRIKNQQCNMRLVFVYLPSEDVYIFIHAFIEKNTKDYTKVVEICNTRIKDVMQEYNCEKGDFLC